MIKVVPTGSLVPGPGSACISEQKVEIFRAMYRNGERLPLLEVMDLQDGRYQLIDGFNRLAAMKLEGFQSTTVIVR
jgi:ParB-like nuclease domain